MCLCTHRHTLFLCVCVYVCACVCVCVCARWVTCGLAKQETGLDRSLYQTQRFRWCDKFAQLTRVHGYLKTVLKHQKTPKPQDSPHANTLDPMVHTKVKMSHKCSDRTRPLCRQPKKCHVLCGAMWHTDTKQDKIYTSRQKDQQ